MHKGTKKIPDKWIKKTESFHRLVQGMIGILANHRCGVDVSDKDFKLSPIFKCEGGVCVRRKEICIRRDSSGYVMCTDDWDRKRVFCEEEKITVEAIEEITEKFKFSKDEKVVRENVIDILKETKLTDEALTDMLGNFNQNPFGDPLRSFYEHH